MYPINVAKIKRPLGLHHEIRVPPKEMFNNPNLWITVLDIFVIRLTLQDMAPFVSKFCDSMNCSNMHFEIDKPLECLEGEWDLRISLDVNLGGDMDNKNYLSEMNQRIYDHGVNEILYLMGNIPLLSKIKWEMFMDKRFPLPLPDFDKFPLTLKVIQEASRSPPLFPNDKEGVPMIKLIVEREVNKNK